MAPFISLPGLAHGWADLLAATPAAPTEPWDFSGDEQLFFVIYPGVPRNARWRGHSPLRPAQRASNLTQHPPALTPLKART